MKCLFKMVFVLLTALCFFACEKEEILKPSPIIEFPYDGIYVVKIGKEITIKPTYENVENAVFSWRNEGKIISTSDSLIFSSTELRDYFIELAVITHDEVIHKDVKISVVKLNAPRIIVNLPENGYKIARNTNLSIEPKIENGNEGCTFSWLVDDKEVSKDINYKFSSDKNGIYKLKFIAKNEDGIDSFETKAEVVNPEELPFKWNFENDSLYMSTGRRIRVKIWDIENAYDAKYKWEVNGIEKQNSEETEFIFQESTQGWYDLKVTMQNSLYQSRSIGMETRTLKIKVCPPEGTNKRPVNASSTARWSRVLEFTAAPGQFVNEYYSVYTQKDAIAYAEERLKEKAYVSLGGFGGYIVIGFDHSIENDGGYNIQSIGNAFKGSSEPGIIMVMQDENGDGYANDTWYELKGSEFETGNYIKDYSLTYYKASAPGMPTPWVDNQGKSGVVDYLGAFHTQDFYYPLWVKSDKITFRGTCLNPRTYEQTPGYWVNEEFDWGYADNFSMIDSLTDDDNYEAGPRGNHFKISDAIDFEGKPMHLEYIDFVKVYTGVNIKAGWLGENSTEVFDMYDFNLIKKK